MASKVTGMPFLGEIGKYLGSKVASIFGSGEYQINNFDQGIKTNALIFKTN